MTTPPDIVVPDVPGYEGQKISFPGDWTPAQIQAAIVKLPKYRAPQGQPPNLGVMPMPPPAQTIAQVATQHTPQDAAQALTMARVTQEPADTDRVLKNPQDAQTQALNEDFRQSLEASPELQEYAGRSPAHAAMVRNDSGALARLSHWILGRFDGIEQSFVKQAFGQKPDPITYDPPIFLQELKRGAVLALAGAERSTAFVEDQSLKAANAVTGDRFDEAFPGLRDQPKGANSLANLLEAGERTPIPDTEKGLGAVAGKSLEMAPGLLPLMLAPEAEIGTGARLALRLAARAPSAAILAFQNVGPRYRELLGDGYAPNDAARIAALGSTLGAAAGSVASMRFAKGMLPAKAQGWLGNAFSKSLTDLFMSKGFLAQGAGIANHVADGALFTTAMRMVDASTDYIYNGLKKGEWDTSILSAGFQRAKEDMATLTPLALGIGAARLGDTALGHTGRWARAFSDRAELEGMNEQLAQVKFMPPTEMVDYLDSMLAKRPDRQTIYIPTEQLGAALRKAGFNPSSIEGYDAAESAGVVGMKTSHFLLLPQEMRDQLLDHAKFNPKGFTFDEARKATPEVMRDWEAWANEEQPAPGSPARSERPDQIPIDLSMQKKVMAAQAKEYVAGLPIGRLQAGADLYETQRNQAQRELDKRQTQTVNQMSTAHNTAQQGIDAALADQTQRAQDKSVSATQSEVKAGERSAEADKATARRDAADVLNKAHARAAAEAEKVQGQFARMAKNTEPYERSAADGLGSEYKDAFNTVMSHLGLGGREASPMQDPSVLYDRLNASGFDDKTTQFDRAAFAAWLKDPKPLDSMTLAEAKDLRNALTSIRKAAGAANEITLRNRTVTRAAFVKQAETELEKRGFKPGKFTYGESQSILAKYKASKNQPAVMWEAFGQPGQEHNEQFYEARNLNGQLRADHDAFVKDAHDKLDAELRGLHGESFTPYGGLSAWMNSKVPALDLDVTRNPNLEFLWPHGKVRRADVIAMAMQSGTESGLEKMAAGYGVKPEDLTTYLNQTLTKPEWDFAARYWKHNDALFELLSKVKEDSTGVPLEPLARRSVYTPHGVYEGGYSPFRWYDADHGLPKYSDTDVYRGETEGMDTDTGSVHARTKFDAAVPRIDFASLDAHYKSVLHHIAFSKFVREQYGLLTDPAFKNLVRDRIGQAFYDNMWEAHKVVVDGDLVPEKTASTAAQVLNAGTNIAARAVFVNNVPIMLGQEGHITTAGANFGVSMRNITQGIRDSLMPERVAQNMQESKSLQYMAQDWDRKLFELERANIGYKEGGALDSAYRKLHLIDTPARYFAKLQYEHIGNAIYSAVKAQALENGLPEAEARRAADRAINLSMPKLNVMEQSALVRDHTITGSVVLVRNYPNELSGMNTIREWERRAQLSDGASSALKIYGASAVRSLAFLGSLMATHYAIGHGRNEEEVKEGMLGTLKFAARSAIEAMAYSSPLAYPALQLATPTLLQEHPKGHYKKDMFRVAAIDLVNDLGRKWLKFADDPTQEKPARAALMSTGRMLFGAYPMRLMEIQHRLRNGPSPRFLNDSDLAQLGARLYGDHASNIGYDVSQATEGLK